MFVVQFAGAMASVFACWIVNLTFMELSSGSEYNAAFIMSFVVGLSYQLCGYVTFADKIRRGCANLRMRQRAVSRLGLSNRSVSQSATM